MFKHDLLAILIVLMGCTPALGQQEKQRPIQLGGHIIGHVGVLDNLGDTSPQIGTGDGVEVKSRQMQTATEKSFSIAQKRETGDGRSGATDLPDAPSERVLRMAADLPDVPTEAVADIPSSDIPDAPSERIWDKKMWTAHGIFLASIVFDYEITHYGTMKGRCDEGNSLGPHPTRGQLYRDGMMQFAVGTGLDWLLAYANKKNGVPKWFWKPSGYMSATWGTVIHTRGGIQWFTHGCL